MRAKMWHCWCYLWVCLCGCIRKCSDEERTVHWDCGSTMMTSHFVHLTDCCAKDGHQHSYWYPRFAGLDFSISNLAPPPPPPPSCSLILSLPPSFSPSFVSLPFIYQIVSMRSQLSPDRGSFLGWISVKWTRGIGRQSMTLSWDERERE